MTIQQIRYVLALDIHRHFIKAAESCFVGQSTLTIQVKKLEEEIGILIFDRTEHPLKPTPMGEVFVAKSRQIMRDIQELKDIFTKEINQINGVFKIGIIPTLSPYLLPRFTDSFFQRHSETFFEIEELESESIIQELKIGKLDLAIMATPLNEPNLREIPLFYEPFLLYANEENNLLHDKNKKIKVNQLNLSDIWLLKQGHCFRNQMLNICDFRDLSNNRNIIFEGGSIETLKTMIKQTSGYTLIPELSFNKNLDTKNVIRFEVPEPCREISLIVHKKFTKEKLIEELRKSILENIPKQFKTKQKFKTVKWR